MNATWEGPEFETYGCGAVAPFGGVPAFPLLSCGAICVTVRLRAEGSYGFGQERKTQVLRADLNIKGMGHHVPTLSQIIIYMK